MTPHDVRKEGWREKYIGIMEGMGWAGYVGLDKYIGSRIAGVSANLSDRAQGKERLAGTFHEPKKS